LIAFTNLKRSTVILVGILLVNSCSSLLTAKGEKRPEKKTEFGIGTKVGSGILRYHSTCILFQVFFISGQFFEGLHEIGPPTARQFKKDAVLYRNFPDRLIADVQATAWNCSGATLPVGPSFGEGLMSGASLTASWEDEHAKTGPVTPLSREERHRPTSLVWDYFLEISAKDIPLTERLQIDVSLRQGTAQTRLSAGLQ
jgi:hypothetical protein